jgi:L-rhamnose mutarotase
MKRYGMVTRIRPEGYENYKKLHAEAWPEVLEIIKASNIQNYSIYYREGLLFSYFEYVGDDFEADMAKMADEEITRKWWAACTPDFNPYTPGEYWAPMEEVFYLK